MTRRLVIATALFAALATQAGEAYIRGSLIVDNRRLFLRVSPPVLRYFVLDRGVPQVTSAQLRDALARAHTRWQELPTSAISFESVGFTSALPLEFDSQHTIGFLADPESPDVLGLSSIILDAFTGIIVDSDIAFNSVHDWSVAEDGVPERFDLESVAVHEMGHMFGLGHSGIGQMVAADGSGGVAAAETVLFPFAYDPGTIAGRELKADDIAGASVMYPDGGFLDATGILHGRVDLGGAPVFGAHVIAFNPSTGDMVGGFTYENGEFMIGGLSPGRYVIRIEPVDDGAPSDYLDEGLEVGFRTRFLDRLVTVQRGATTPRVDITVEPK